MAKLPHLSAGLEYGEPVEASGISLTPVARTISVQTPFGGLVWNRPVAIYVTDDGVTTPYSIPAAQWSSLAGASAAGAVLAIALAALFRRRHNLHPGKPAKRQPTKASTNEERNNE